MHKMVSLYLHDMKRPCTEDSGSIPHRGDLEETFGEKLMSNLKKDRSFRGNADMKRWYKTECMNGDKEDLNPYRSDVSGVNCALYEYEMELDEKKGRGDGD